MASELIEIGKGSLMSETSSSFQFCRFKISNRAGIDGAVSVVEISEHSKRCARVVDRCSDVIFVYHVGRGTPAVRQLVPLQT